MWREKYSETQFVLNVKTYIIRERVYTSGYQDNMLVLYFI
jgi:hypothetical protein